MIQPTDSPWKGADPQPMEDGTLAPGKERALIRHLPYFATLVEEGHFGRAAARLAMSQSALTRRIQSLEAELEVKLFARDRRTARLTEAGRAFYEHTQAILREMRNSIRHVRKVVRGEAGILGVAMTDGGVQVGAVAESFRAFRKLYPEVEIKLHSMYSRSQLAHIRSEDLDIGFLYDIVIDIADRKDLASVPLFSDQLCLVMNEAHPLASRERLRIADLTSESFAWFSGSEGRSFSDAVMTAFHAAGVTPKIATAITTETTTITMAQADLAVGFVREAATLPAGVVLRRVDDMDVRVSAHAVWLRANDKPSLKNFLDLLREKLRAA